MTGDVTAVRARRPRFPTAPSATSIAGMFGQEASRRGWASSSTGRHSVAHGGEQPDAWDSQPRSCHRAPFETRSS
jgi:hypothetical protein